MPEPEALPALDDLVPLVLDELRVLAHRQIAREHGVVTLQTTALVHEAYLRLENDQRVISRGRPYFFAAAARAMRQVLVDAARSRLAAKRGGGVPLASLSELDGQPVEAYGAELLALDEALEELARRNPRRSRVIECRFFGGRNVEDTAAALGVSPRTVKADWALARAWLYRTLQDPHGV